MKRHEVQHFDIPVNLSYVDKMPYVHDRELCTKEMINVHSGNLIKRYNVEMEEEKFVIEPMDFDPNIVESKAKVVKSTPVTDTSNTATQNSTDSDTTPTDVASDASVTDEYANLAYEEQADDYYSEQ